ncbi:MAG: YggT family protein [Microbacteriaceae bacterium]|jgi:YggT family protein|nr:MAG: hypothetical protein ABR66_05950 [Microbacteriaceae bacterium BACL25 MAG-120322-bin65]HAA79925.1 hypothetical protein [Microbacteriaceae bacterium]|tara:strand:+ start:933 stop:1223 length:291 start_codon:yes stop_codon:yes gene_type:complete
MLSLIASVVYFALYVFLVAMWVRFAFDWVRVLSRTFQPKGPLVVIAELAYSLTDRPLSMVRRVIPTIRFGGAAIDLGWSALLLVTLVVLSIVDGYR